MTLPEGFLWQLRPPVHGARHLWKELCPQPMNTSAPLPLGWDNSKAHVLYCFLNFSGGIELNYPEW